MRYRLRTLMIVLALGPPLLAGLFLYSDALVMVVPGTGPILFVVAVAYVLVAIESIILATQKGT